MQHPSHCGAAKVYGSPSATLRWSAPISPNKGLGTARTFASTTIAHPQYLVYPQNNKIKTTLQIDYQDKISSFCHKTDNFIARKLGTVHKFFFYSNSLHDEIFKQDKTTLGSES